MKKLGFVKALALVAMTVPASLSFFPENAAAYYKKSSLEINNSLIISPGANSLITNDFNAVSGGLVWYDFGVGARIRVTDQLSMIPGVDFMLNYFTGEQYYLSNFFYMTYTYSCTSLIVMPRIGLRYELEPQETGWYIEGQVSGSSPSSELLDIKSGGMGYAVGIGYTLPGDWRVELNYTHVPIDTYLGTKNFGGVGFKFGLSF